MQQHDEQAIIAHTVQALAPYEDTMLLTALKQVLEQRPSVVQELADWALPDRAYASARIMMENRLTGVIKSFNPANGYGFIESAEVQGAFGSDVFLHASQLNGYNRGDQVSFALLVNTQRKPQAYDLGSTGGSWGKGKGAKGAGKVAAQAAAWGADQSGGTDFNGWPESCFNPAVDAGKGKGEGKGKGKVYTPMETAMEMEGVTDRRFDGLIKSFNEVKGFGFIACDEITHQFGCDVFLHHFQYTGFEVGQAVSFNVILNKQGKPQAQELAPLIPSIAGAGEPAAKKGRWGL